MATERQLQQKQARSSELRSAHLTQIRRKALDETTKVHEVLFINKLQNKDKELTLMQRLQVCSSTLCTIVNDTTIIKVTVSPGPQLLPPDVVMVLHWQTTVFILASAHVSLLADALPAVSEVIDNA